MAVQIILASASPRRRELLAQIGIEFIVKTSSLPETYTAEKPEDIVRELARKKAENVAEELPAPDRRSTLILGADTVVVLDGQILGKPRDEEDAFAMLHALQGRAHDVYTGAAILHFDEYGERTVSMHAEKTRVHVHAMDEREIREYIAAGESMDKAGAYGIQGRFAAFIDGIEGDYYNVVGLPVSAVYRELKPYLDT